METCTSKLTLKSLSDHKKTRYGVNIYSFL